MFSLKFDFQTHHSKRKNKIMDAHCSDANEPQTKWRYTQANAIFTPIIFFFRWAKQLRVIFGYYVANNNFFVVHLRWELCCLRIMRFKFFQKLPVNKCDTLVVAWLTLQLKTSNWKNERSVDGRYVMQGISYSNNLFFSLVEKKIRSMRFLFASK